MNKTSVPIRYLVAFGGLVVSMYALADVPPEQKPEVEHLVQFVADSHCIIHRNDTDHDAKEAAHHITSKYKYYRNEIRSTEDFIRYSGTRSTITGRRYSVSCPGQHTIDMQRWLTDELIQYRAEKSDSDNQ
jgi:hypothetical protein